MAITFYNDLVLHSVIVIGSIKLRIYVLGSNKVSDVHFSARKSNWGSDQKMGKVSIIYNVSVQEVRLLFLQEKEEIIINFLKLDTAIL